MRKYEHEETKAMKEVIQPIVNEEVALLDLWDKFMSDYKPWERGMMVCSFLAHEIEIVHECLKTSSTPNDQELLNALILVYGWTADVTENEDLRNRIELFLI
jgi:hypothetical protein